MQNLFNESSVVHEAYQKIHLGSKYVEYALEIYLIYFIQKKKIPVRYFLKKYFVKNI